MSASGKTTLDPGTSRPSVDAEGAGEALAFVVVWAPHEPHRLGEILFPRDGAVFGRGAESDGEERVSFVRQRPQTALVVPPSEDPFLSRKQLRFHVSDEHVEIEVLGKRSLRLGGGDVRAATIAEGDVFELEGRFAFHCVRRPAVFREGAAAAKEPRVFGEADDLGIVGESVAAWALRGAIAFAASRKDAHVLVTGPSGTGKELVAQAIHRLSARARGELVSRNAATFPAGLIDAELFGNMQNYPHHGMPARPGIVGEADGGTLFLDEIGELPVELQAHLLRVLDRGEYQRLGESKRRRADMRLVAATNRAPSDLKHDLAARLALRVELPGLDDRREDVPLLARHLLRSLAAGDPELGEAFFEGWNGTTGEPRLAVDLVRALVLHAYTTHVREIQALLLRSAATSRGRELELTPAVRKLVTIAPRHSPKEITADAIRAALARHEGVKDRVWRDLGLPSRHALHRLMRKLGLDSD